MANKKDIGNRTHVPPEIILGVNLGFANFVYSHDEAFRIVRRECGLRDVQTATDLATDLPLYLHDRAAFKRRYTGIGRQAAQRGIRIWSVFPWYRDSYTMTHRDPAMVRIGIEWMRALFQQAACFIGTGHPVKTAGGIFGSIFREDYRNTRVRRQVLDRAVKNWKKMMHEAYDAGLEILTVEQMSILSEPPATREQARELLAVFDAYHRRHPKTTVPLQITYDTGHAVSAVEGSRGDRSFRSWFTSIPEQIPEVHLKNTDPQFLSTWPFTPEYIDKGIIDPVKVVEAVRDELQAPQVMLFLEIAGKRGRDVTEKKAVRDLVRSTETVTRALRACGYAQRRDGTWRCQPDR